MTRETRSRLNAALLLGAVLLLSLEKGAVEARFWTTSLSSQEPSKDGLVLGQVGEFEWEEDQALAAGCKKAQPQESTAVSKWETSRYLIEPYSIPGPMKWNFIPKTVQDEFTLNGRIPLSNWFINNEMTKLNNKQRVWPEKMIQGMVALADKRDPNVGKQLSQYAWRANDAFFKALTAHPIRGKSCLVIGSQKPWVEAILISFGAGKITTVDFNPPACNDTRLTIVGIPDLDKATETFDVIVSYSSLEHDGLGRYGDPLNPWGDLRRMAKVKTLMKPDGKFFLGVPVGKDALQFNAHRIYGPIRWKLLIKGWRFLEAFWNIPFEDLWELETVENQPLAVLSLRP